MENLPKDFNNRDYLIVTHRLFENSNFEPSREALLEAYERAKIELKKEYPMFEVEEKEYNPRRERINWGYEFYIVNTCKTCKKEKDNS